VLKKKFLQKSKRNMRQLLILLSSLLIVLPACLPQRSRIKNVRQPVNALAPWAHIAQLVDLPPAPETELQQVTPYSYDNGENYYLTFMVRGALEGVEAFYHSEMDSLGWQEVMVSSRPGELVMVYLKPSRICVIHAQGATIRIVVAPNGTNIPLKTFAV
jgi:hypothetical protein